MRIEERKKELDLMRKNEEEKRRKLLEEEKLLRETKPSLSFTPAPVSERIRPTPSPRSTADHRYEVKTICEKCRCKLLNYNEQGHAIYIEVAGPDHSAISDILPLLIQAGVVNFTEHREKFGVKMINGARMYFAAYTLRW